MSKEKVDLRVVTYMCPTHPVQLYELILELLETEVDCWTTLQYESRSPGPFPDRPDPFENNKVDLAFMTASAYMKLCRHNNEWAELLPATPVFAHQMNVENQPGYFCDVIIHSDKKAHNVNTLIDLRGCTFAYSDEESLSGSKVVLKTLKSKGENASFFGSLLRSGSHWASAQMVLTKQAEWATVDSTTLLYSKKFMQDGGKDIITLETLGRLPPYPIVINKRIPEGVKKSITNALHKCSEKPEWKKRFAKFGVIKFDANSDDAYDGPAAQVWAAAGARESLSVRYAPIRLHRTEKKGKNRHADYWRDSLQENMQPQYGVVPSPFVPLSEDPPPGHKLPWSTGSLPTRVGRCKENLHSYSEALDPIPMIDITMLVTVFMSRAEQD